jgi:hypothetical protein
MARPRKPTAALELAGAFEVNPARKLARADEPIPQGELGDAPEYLDPVARAIWNEMAGVAFWLTDADAFLLEIAAILMARFRVLPGFESKDVAVLVNTLNKLGFGPAERSKIKAPRAKDAGDEGPTGFAKLAKPR